MRRSTSRSWLLLVLLALMPFAPLPGRVLLIHAHGAEGHHVHSLPSIAVTAEPAAEVHGDAPSEHVEHAGLSSSTSHSTESSEGGFVVSVPAFILSGSGAGRFQWIGFFAASPMGMIPRRFDNEPPLAREAWPPSRSVPVLDRGSGIVALLRSSHALLI